MELKQIQESTGAIFDSTGKIVSFQRDDEAKDAIDTEKGVVICDRAWGLLKITGEDRLRYLHNQSTNDFEKLHSRQGCDTVFVTSTARTLDLASAYVTEDAVLLIISPNRRQQLLTWLDRFIFPFDKVELNDLSADYAVFSLIGEASQGLLSQLSGTISLNNYGEHQLITLADVPVRVGLGSGLATFGYRLIVKRDRAGAVWSKIIEAGAIPGGDRLWESLRILQGRPESDRELTEDYNPLEAGLWQTISFEKGCYIGQETIARLNTYNGVKQKLWGIELDRPALPQTAIILEDKKVGILTSYVDTSNGYFGLGYVRTKAGGEGLQVKVGEALGKLVSVPFIRHEQ